MLQSNDKTNEIRLRIRNLTTEDQGTWECLGMDSTGRPNRRSFQLTIKGLFDISYLIHTYF